MPRCSAVPRTRPRSSGLAPATAAALALLPILLTACRSTPTPTRPPITWPSPWPSATSEPSATPRPRPTRTAMPTVDPAVPLPVAMSLDEAHAEVLSWLDPGHAPRIVSVDYVPGAAVAAHRFITGEIALFDTFGGRNEMRLLDGNRMPPSLVRVVAECAPLDAPLLVRMTGLRGGGPQPLSDDPSTLIALFDATTGARLAAYPVDRTPNDQIDTALAAPTIAIPFRATRIPPTATSGVPTQTPRPTPTTVPTPIGPPVGADSVPPAMRAVLTAYPLLPGSTWTWESASWEGGVSWTRSRMTETVQAVWRLDDARLAVRSVVVRRRGFGPTAISVGPERSVVWRTVASSGAVYAYPARLDETSDEDRGAMGTATEVAGLRLPLESLVFPHDSVDWSWPEAITTTRSSVTTPAGRFADCGAFAVMGGSGWGSVRTICPHVGYVETDSWHWYSAGIGRSVTQLVGYHVVLPR